MLLAYIKFSKLTSWGVLLIASSFRATNVEWLPTGNVPERFESDWFNAEDRSRCHSVNRMLLSWLEN